MRTTTRTQPTTTTTGLADIPCITQDPQERPPARYLDVCTGVADLLSTSVACEGTGCGGHPICRPCYELAVRDGWAA